MNSSLGTKTNEAQPMSVRFFKSGYCTSHSKVVDPRTSFREIPFAAVWALIDLPSGDYAMVDTGYAPHFITATKPFPDRFYRWITPMHLQPQETPVAILSSLGINPSQIRWIVISHFHADHIAGLQDFPQAQFVCSAAALQPVRQFRGFGAVKRGILHGLLPTNFFDRVQTIESLSEEAFVDSYGLQRFRWSQMPTLTWAILPGHATGMMGFEFVQGNQPIFYATDAAWGHRAFADHVLPSPVVKIFIDSMSDLEATWHALHRWQKDHPQGKIYFTHCPESEKLLYHE